MHARPTCTLRGTSYVCTRTVGSRRKSVRRVSRRISTVRGQNPSVESYSRVPGHWHRQWTALDLPFMCLNMSLFCGVGRDGLGVLMITLTFASQVSTLIGFELRARRRRPTR